MYHAKCPSELCDENYVGESGRRIAEREKERERERERERVKDRNGRDHKWHILKHSLETGHKCVKTSDFLIIYKNFSGNNRKRKIAKSLLIKQLSPTLNIHDKSIPLKLFN